MDLDAFRQTEIFRDVDADSLAQLAAWSVRREYQRGELVTGVEAGRDDIVVICRGEARLYRISRSGRQVTLGILSAGDVFGVAVANGRGDSKTSVEALTDRTVAFHIPAWRFEEFVSSHPEAAIAGMRIIAGQLIDVYDLVEDLSFNQLHVRLAHVLARLARQDSGHAVTRTHEELATMISASREEVTKTLRGFRERGLVRYPRHQSRIIVPDPDALSALELSVHR